MKGPQEKIIAPKTIEANHKETKLGLITILTALAIAGCVEPDPEEEFPPLITAGNCMLVCAPEDPDTIIGTFCPKYKLTENTVCIDIYNEALNLKPLFTNCTTDTDCSLETTDKAIQRYQESQ